MATYTSTVTQPSGRTIIAYIFRDIDSQVYRASSGDFIDENLSALQGAARVPYRVTFAERAPGSYYSSIDVTNFQDGAYTLEGREIANDIEYNNILVDKFAVENLSLIHI